jgi:hypothetical protein
MATVRDARRALARGDTDEALVDLWNALEPLRLRDDRSGLHAVAELAVQIAGTGDGSQAREAERLLEAVRDALDPDGGSAARRTVSVGTPEPPAVLDDSAPGLDEDREVEIGEYDPDDVIDVEGDVERPRFRGLVWALIVAAFVIFNIVSGLLRD